MKRETMRDIPEQVVPRKPQNSTFELPDARPGRMRQLGVQLYNIWLRAQSRFLFLVSYGERHKL